MFKISKYLALVAILSLVLIQPLSSVALSLPTSSVKKVVTKTIIAKPVAKAPVKLATPSLTTKERQLQDQITALKNQIAELQQQVTDLRSIASNVNTSTLNGSSLSLASVVATWRPRMADIVCVWNADSSGNVLMKASGSGVVATNNDNTLMIYTNRHVVAPEGASAPTNCTAKVPNNDTIYTIQPKDILLAADSNVDVAFLRVSSADDNLRQLASNGLTMCSVKLPIGDPMVILGYPGIGSKTDITATDGIVAGYDKDFYITSAKVERGNSGGAAISVTQNCYIGIPTFVQVGGIESLARILSWPTISANINGTVPVSNLQ